jgi:hypothetical protein
VDLKCRLVFKCTQGEGFFQLFDLLCWLYDVESSNVFKCHILYHVLVLGIPGLATTINIGIRCYWRILVATELSNLARYQFDVSVYFYFYFFLLNFNRTFNC